VNTKIPRHVKRLLVQQIATARYDKMPNVEKAARRALKAAESGDIAALDAAALEAFRMAENFGIIFDASLDTEEEASPESNNRDSAA